MRRRNSKTWVISFCLLAGCLVSKQIIDLEPGNYHFAHTSNSDLGRQWQGASLNLNQALTQVTIVQDGGVSVLTLHEQDDGQWAHKSCDGKISLTLHYLQTFEVRPDPFDAGWTEIGNALIRPTCDQNIELTLSGQPLEFSPF